MERVSLRIGAREVSFGVDGRTKLVEIAEFDWDGITLTLPTLDVSWWENTLKSRFLYRIIQYLDAKDNLDFYTSHVLYCIQEEAYEEGVEHGSL